MATPKLIHLITVVQTTTWPKVKYKSCGFRNGVEPSLVQLNDLLLFIFTESCGFFQDGANSVRASNYQRDFNMFK